MSGNRPRTAAETLLRSLSPSAALWRQCPRGEPLIFDPGCPPVRTLSRHRAYAITPRHESAFACILSHHNARVATTLASVTSCGGDGFLGVSAKYSVRVSQILTPRYPLQVHGTVVILVAVDVVDLRTLEPCVRMPSTCHETVNVVVHSADFDIDVMFPAVRDTAAWDQYLAGQYFAIGFYPDMRPDASCLAPDETGVGGFVERHTGYDFPLHGGYLFPDRYRNVNLRQPQMAHSNHDSAFFPRSSFGSHFKGVHLPQCSQSARGSFLSCVGINAPI